MIPLDNLKSGKGRLAVDPEWIWNASFRVHQSIRQLPWIAQEPCWAPDRNIGRVSYIIHEISAWSCDGWNGITRQVTWCSTSYSFDYQYFMFVQFLAFCSLLLGKTKMSEVKSMDGQTVYFLSSISSECTKRNNRSFRAQRKAQGSSKQFRLSIDLSIRTRHNTH